MHPFRNNVVILTGASRGIGAELARQLARQGALLMLAARDASLLEQVAEECRQYGAEAYYLATDLTDPEQCRRLVEATVTRFGRVDTLLYNAGKGYPGWFADQPDLNTIRQEMALNYEGLVACVHYALPQLLASRGRIVGVATLGARIGFPYLAGYNASKHAMRGFLNTLRAELQPQGVSVTVIYPGAVATEQLRATLGDNLRKVPSLSPERAATLILRAAGHRQRESVPTAGGRFLLWAYPLFPRLIDRYLYRMSTLYQ